MGKQKGVDAALQLANHLSAYRSYLLLSPTRSCWAGHEALENVDEILWPHVVSSRSIKLNSSRSLWTRKFSLLRIMSRIACRKGTHGLETHLERFLRWSPCFFDHWTSPPCMLLWATHHWIDSARTFWRHSAWNATERVPWLLLVGGM